MREGSPGEQGGGSRGVHGESPEQGGPGGPTWPSHPSSRSKERASSEMRQQWLGAWWLLILKIKQWNESLS